MHSKGSDWKRELKDILKVHNDYHSVKPKGVSFKTMEGRANFFFAFFTELRRNDERNYKVLPSGLRGRHVKFMVSRWVARGLAPGTIQVYLSYLRVFAGWIGKEGMVLEASNYVSDPSLVQRTLCATADHSWSAHGIDCDKLIARVAECDPYVAAQLSMSLAFGLRMKEAIMFQPFRAVTEDGASITLLRGTKGGRVRLVPIDTDAKRAALDMARRVAVTEDGHLGDPRRSLRQNRTRLYTVLARFGVTKRQLGVTAHGLRHQYGNDRYEHLTGAPSPARGGDRLGREVDRSARLQVASELGHARENISTAYLGAIFRSGKLIDSKRDRKDSREITSDCLARSEPREID